MIRIVIVDDQTLMLDGLQTILNLEDDMQVVGAAKSGAEALELIASVRPDFVLMDIQMPGMNGIECMQRVKRAHPDMIVMMLTTFVEDAYIIEALASGATGFLLKNMAGDQLIEAIRSAAKGAYMLPSIIAAKLAARLQHMAQTANMYVDASRLKTAGIAFTDREKNIIRLMLQGKANRHIADSLFMQEGTVKNYISAIYAKIGTSDRTQAVYMLRELINE